MKKMKHTPQWINKYYLFNQDSNKKVFLNNDLIRDQINTFFQEIDKDNKHILILFRVQYNNEEYATIGTLQRLNFTEISINNYIDYITNILVYKEDHYKTEAIKNIIFSYSIREGILEVKEKKFNNNLDIKNDFLSYSQHKLPIAFNPIDYKNVMKITNYDYICILPNHDVIQIKHINKSSTKCKLLSNNELILEYNDKKVNDNTFVRKINSNKYIFEKGKLILKESIKKSNYIKPLKSSNKNNFKFLTLDIETYLDKDNYQIPYCICIYDGKENKSFYLDDFISPEDMLIAAIKSISIRKYKGYNIYAHNFSNFDGIFLLKILNKVGNINPTIKDGKIISVNYIFKSSKSNKFYSLRFCDSILLLQNSLRKLAKSFNCSTQKGDFNTLQVNKDNFKDLKQDVINYCIDDCKSLYEILVKFNQLIYENFNISIKNYPTIPSLTFANFRTNYLKDNEIAQISGKIHKDIRKSYTGGKTEMYIPYNQEDNNLYYIDVNSLYPSVMKKYDFPVGPPTYFEGDIRKINNEAFGIFFCEIKSPEYLEHPIIQTHVKTKNGTRTISPLGNWYDWICSPEMDNAIKYGYDFKIIKGYTFEKGKIFSENIDKLYKLRLKYPKSDPMNYIAKLFMNSLYGRFGMDDNFNELRIVNNEEMIKLTSDIKINIKDIINLGEDYIIQILKNEEQINNSFIDNIVENHNVNISIASFVTSYSRVDMSPLLNNKNFNIYYTDTDSYIISLNKDFSLLDNLLSNTELGKFKLEYKLKKAIFLAPKLYCFETIDGKIITKTRGLSHDQELTFSEFESLLFKDSSIIKNQEKWFKNMYEGTIKIENLPYDIRYTENKRHLIFNDEDKLIATKPFTINKNKEIVN
jgi:hypothetical protein